MQNNRREFLKTSLKAGVVLGFGGLVSELSAAGTSSNASKGVKMITLNNGVKMPILGLGTYGLYDKECVDIVREAAILGYRLFDTAQMYRNESELAQGLRESGVSRNELFITTKLSNEMSYEGAKRHIEQTLKDMKLEYLDLILLHRNFRDSKGMYKAMEDFYEQGRIKALGLSNFTEQVYLDFIKTCKIAPAVNQMETHVFLQHSAYQELMQKNGNCKLESWSPFVHGRNGIFDNAVLKSIAAKHNKSVAQVVLRWLVQREVIVIPKTSKVERLKENISIFDFELDSTDLAQIAKLDTGKSSVNWWQNL